MTTDAYWARAVDAALAGIVDQGGMDLAFGARATPDGRQLVIERVRGGVTTALQDLAVRGGTGLGGKAMVLRRPVTVNDYLSARGISHHYDGPVSREGIHAIMAVPIVVSNRVAGVLYAALRQRLGIGDRMQHLAVTTAQQTQRRLAAVSRRDQDPRDVRAELRSVIDRVVDPDIRARLEAIHARLSARQAFAPAPAALSAREYDTLRLAALGLTSAEIGDRMGLAPATVKAYLRSVMRKLDCHNRIAAVNAARGLGYDL
jgi:DNA-binding CsgD family transcriptional regulator